MILQLRTRTYTHHTWATDVHIIVAFTETNDATVFDTCYWQWDMVGDRSTR